MALLDEDFDLQALRNAVLATIKPSPSCAMQPGSKEDDEDLESLRLAALHSKKPSETAVDQNPANSLNDLIRLGPKFQQNNRLDNIFCRKPNSNLIEIKPIPIEFGVPGERQPFAFRPTNKIRPFVKEETSSLQRNEKPKSNSKFSRFETDSESDDDSDFDFPTRSASSSDDEQSSERCASEDDVQLGSDKENEDEDDEEEEDDDDEGVDSSVHASEKDEKRDDEVEESAMKEETKDGEKDTCVVQSATKPVERGNEDKSSDIVESDKKRLDAGKGVELNIKPVNAGLHCQNDRSNGRACKRRSGGGSRDKCNQIVKVADQSGNTETERLEARRRKFESQHYVIPDKSVKISLKGIIRTLHTTSASSKEKICSNVKVSQSVEKQTLFSDSESDDDAAEKRAGKRLARRLQSNRAFTPIEEKMEKGLSFSDIGQDLRISLRQRQEERQQKRSCRHSASSSTSSRSSTSPVLKSVLSIVKVETHRERRKSSRRRKTRKRNFDVMKPVVGGTERRSEKRQKMDNDEKRNRDRSPLLTSNDVSVDQSQQSTQQPKLPVRLRLGLPTSKSFADTDGVQQRDLQEKDRLSPRRQQQQSQRKASSHDNGRSNNVDACTTLTTTTTVTSGVIDPASAGDTQFTVSFDLEAKIRRIREQNAAIIRRREEVAADRKKHS